MYATQGMRSSHCYTCKCTHHPRSGALCSLTLASISIALLLLFLGLWIYFIARAYRRILRLNYAENRLANISVRIQVGAHDGCGALCHGQCEHGFALWRWAHFNIDAGLHLFMRLMLLLQIRNKG